MSPIDADALSGDYQLSGYLNLAISAKHLGKVLGCRFINSVLDRSEKLVAVTVNPYRRPTLS